MASIFWPLSASLRTSSRTAASISSSWSPISAVTVPPSLAIVFGGCRLNGSIGLRPNSRRSRTKATTMTAAMRMYLSMRPW